MDAIRHADQIVESRFYQLETTGDMWKMDLIRWDKSKNFIWKTTFKLTRRKKIWPESRFNCLVRPYCSPCGNVLRINQFGTAATVFQVCMVPFYYHTTIEETDSTSIGQQTTLPVTSSCPDLAWAGLLELRTITSIVAELEFIPQLLWLKALLRKRGNKHPSVFVIPLSYQYYYR